MADVRIGISGWRYPPWRGVFYPKGLVQDRELEYASRQFRTLEINGTFYALQRPEYFTKWRETVPEDFVFSVKGNRFITHMRKLRDAEQPLANFFASGVLNLNEKLGPFLWQMPPSFGFDPERLEAFFTLLPRDTASALALAKRHDATMAGRAALAIDANRPLRHAMEVRHDSFHDPLFADMLRRHGVALVVADTSGKWPYLEDVTADFLYLRLHGDKALYRSGYGEAALDHWAARIRAWKAGGQVPDAVTLLDDPPPKRAGRDIYCYFDNEAKVHAPFNAAALAVKLGG